MAHRTRSFEVEICQAQFKINGQPMDLLNYRVLYANDYKTVYSPWGFYEVKVEKLKAGAVTVILIGLGCLFQNTLTGTFRVLFRQLNFDFDTANKQIDFSLKFKCEYGSWIFGNNPYQLALELNDVSDEEVSNNTDDYLNNDPRSSSDHVMDRVMSAIFANSTPGQLIILSSSDEEDETDNFPVFASNTASNSDRNNEILNIYTVD